MKALLVAVALMLSACGTTGSSQFPPSEQQVTASLWKAEVLYEAGVKAVEKAADAGTLNTATKQKASAIIVKARGLLDTAQLIGNVAAASQVEQLMLDLHQLIGG